MSPACQPDEAALRTEAPPTRASIPAVFQPGKTQFRAVLCDDNPDDREHFQHLIRRHPSIQLAGSAATFSEALGLVMHENADVLFLESAISGSSILSDCTLVPPAVKLIFVTKDPSAAARAFELDAIDYLIKPILPARLSETVRRLLRIEWRRPEANPPASRISTTLLIPFERGRRGVSLDSMAVIQAFGNYTRISFDGSPGEIVLRSLAKWEKLLPTPPFLRVHRNTIVNAARVRSLEGAANGSILHVHGFPETIPVSRRCLAQVRQLLFTSSQA